MSLSVVLSLLFAIVMYIAMDSPVSVSVLFELQWNCLYSVRTAIEIVIAYVSVIMVDKAW